MRMYAAGQWIDAEKKINVLSPYDGTVSIECHVRIRAM